MSVLLRSSCFLFFVLAITLSSCNKELSTENGNIINPADSTTDSIYLDRVYDLDINGGIVDTNEIWIYNYDNLKRVSSLILKTTDDMYVDSYYYFYNNLDSLPYKTMLVKSSSTSTTRDTTSYYHFWDAIGRNLQDSIVDGSSASVSALVKDYFYGVNKVYERRRTVDLLSGTTNVVATDTATTDNHGDILNSKDYDYNSANNTSDQVSNTDYTYSDKKSPFSILSNFKTFGVFPTGETLYFDLPGLYNRTSQVETNPMMTNSITFSNVYSSSNQLKEVNIEDLSMGVTYYKKIKLYYKRL